MERGLGQTFIPRVEISKNPRGGLRGPGQYYLSSQRLEGLHYRQIDRPPSPRCRIENILAVAFRTGRKSSVRSPAGLLECKKRSVLPGSSGLFRNDTHGQVRRRGEENRRTLPFDAIPASLLGTVEGLIRG